MKKYILLLILCVLSVGCGQKKEYRLLLVVNDKHELDGVEILATSDKNAVKEAVKLLDDKFDSLRKKDDKGVLYSDILYNLKRSEDGKIIWGYGLGDKYGSLKYLYGYEPKILSKKIAIAKKEEKIAFKDAQFGMKRESVLKLSHFKKYVNMDAEEYGYAFSFIYSEDTETIGNDEYQVRLLFDAKKDELFQVGFYSPLFEIGDYNTGIKHSMDNMLEFWKKDYGSPQFSREGINARYVWSVGKKSIILCIEKLTYGYQVQSLIRDVERYGDFADSL